ncbi:hypothetical protein Mp_3g10070 [Marchantia polymorpha subsp. ruderalis]|uniref:Uncharacterized protein n=2 Tax=Marchantia polymorpha TaxID=3197 RepID=A0AAF6AZ92_MARPO|nr:hypothetical protein MARPO_0085s0020 [Marchantia polymorpha]BBN05076.1 hypothetical protein Mp_3g10070 [Marchantia polymorpha subsp. ruderalis]|eukprot:PTQ33797.1 hypothetical protein MARPO_0085s0020 [Marchantia polymorpha]
MEGVRMKYGSAAPPASASASYRPAAMMSLVLLLWRRGDGLGRRLHGRIGARGSEGLRSMQRVRGKGRPSQGSAKGALERTNGFDGRHFAAHSRAGLCFWSSRGHHNGRVFAPHLPACLPACVVASFSVAPGATVWIRNAPPRALTTLYSAALKWTRGLGRTAMAIVMVMVSPARPPLGRGAGQTCQLTNAIQGFRYNLHYCLPDRRTVHPKSRADP